MELLLLTKTTGILRPIAIVLGWIINYIYKFLEVFGIENVGLAIVLFTVIVNLLMLPLTIRQQRYSKLSSVITPEIQKIQKKYEGKDDEVSMRRMQAETQAVYKKYGTSTMGGCIYLLIQMPILFALYRVITDIPAYVDSVYAIYEPIANNILAYTDGMEIANVLIEELSLSVSAFETDTFTTNKVIDMLYTLSESEWAEFTSAFGSDVIIAENVETLNRVNSFIGGLNIANNPTSDGWWPGILVPLLAGLTQWLSTKISSATNGTQKQSEQNDQMANQMKTMNTIMPIFSIIICFSLQIGIGIYWISSAVVRTIISVCVNKYLDKEGIDAIVAKNMAKAEKKAQKQIEKTGVDPRQIENYAQINTKKIKSISELAGTSVEGNVYTKDGNQSKKNSSSGNKSKNSSSKNKKSSSKGKESSTDKEKALETGTVVAASELTENAENVVAEEVKADTKAASSDTKKEEDTSKEKKKSRKFGKNKEKEKEAEEEKSPNIAAYANMLKKK